MIFRFLEDISLSSLIVLVIHSKILTSVQATSQITLLSGDIHGKRNVLLDPFPNPVLLPQNAGVSKLEIKIVVVSTCAPIMLFSVSVIQSYFNL
jgi:hypothetical protein